MAVWSGDLPSLLMAVFAYSIGDTRSTNFVQMMAVKIKTDTFANSVDPDEPARNEPSRSTLFGVLC